MQKYQILTSLVVAYQHNEKGNNRKSEYEANNIFKHCLLQILHAKGIGRRLGYLSNSPILELWAQV
jgi:hypothetical protein